jgi:hypothetical protein
MIKCIRFRRFEKNTLKGFADFELTKVGLIIRDCTFHESNGKGWVGFPARSYTDPATGEIKWQALVEFAPGARESREQFRKQAVEAIHAAVADEEPVSWQRPS